MRYIPSFRNAVNAGGSDNYFDTATGLAAIRQWDQLKRGGDSASRKTARNIGVLLAKIFGYREIEIDASSDMATLLITADDQEYTLGDLGSGFTQFFVALVSVGFYAPSFLLIDEPELSLHPSLQVSFLSTLESFTKYGIV